MFISYKTLVSFSNKHLFFTHGSVGQLRVGFNSAGLSQAGLAWLQASSRFVCAPRWRSNSFSDHALQWVDDRSTAEISRIMQCLREPLLQSCLSSHITLDKVTWPSSMSIGHSRILHPQGLKKGDSIFAKHVNSIYHTRQKVINT